jgi:hypothetical protein
VRRGLSSRLAVPSHQTWPGGTSLTGGGPDRLRRRPAIRLTEVGPWAPFSRWCLIEVGPRWPFSRWRLTQSDLRSGDSAGIEGLHSQLTNLSQPQLAHGAHRGRGEPDVRAFTASCRDANGSKTKEVPQGSSSSKNAGHCSSSPSATGSCSKTWPQQHNHQRCCASPVVATATCLRAYRAGRWPRLLRQRQSLETWGWTRGAR